MKTKYSPLVVFAAVALATLLCSSVNAQGPRPVVRQAGMAQWNFEDGDHFQVVTTIPLQNAPGSSPSSLRIGSFFDIFIEYLAVDGSGNPTRGTATLQISVAPAPVARGRFRVVDITTLNTTVQGAKESQLSFHVTVDGNDGGTQTMRLNGLPPGEPVIGTLTVHGETSSPDVNKGDPLPLSKMFASGKDGHAKAHSEGFFDITY